MHEPYFFFSETRGNGEQIGRKICLRASIFSTQDFDLPFTFKNLNRIIEAQHEQIENYASEIENLRIEMESMEKNKEINEKICAQKKVIQIQKENILELQFSEEKLQMTIEEQKEIIAKLAFKIEKYRNSLDHEDENEDLEKSYSLFKEKHKKLQKKYYLLCKNNDLEMETPQGNESKEGISSNYLNF